MGKIWDLILPGAFLDKPTPDFDFTYESVIQFDITVVKLL